MYFSAFLDIIFLSFKNNSWRWIFLVTTVYSDSEDCDDLDESSQAESNNDDGNKECDSDSDGL